MVQGGNSKGNFNLSLMHSNDTHANLTNIARKVTAVKEVRAKKPNALLVDAGDVFSGSLYFNEFKGQADLAFMNLMGYDVMTFGNHEFDLGSSSEGHQALVDFIEGAQFPFVSANVDFSKDGKFTGLFSDLISSDPKNGKIYNGIIKEINGEKVGIFGLTTAETKDISSPGSIEFENYIKEAEKAVKAFEDKGVNKIIALTHIGYDDNPAYDNDLMLAKSVAGIDVIVGGHSHTQLDKPVVVDKNMGGQAKDKTIIVQAYQYNDYLGTLDVTFNPQGVVIAHNGALLKVADYAEDANAVATLKPYKDVVDAVSKSETGATATVALENPRDNGDKTKPSVRKNETPLGNVITDGMLAKAKKYNPDVIMALQNGGGIRTAINQGPITVGEVISVLPFGNTLATVTLTGAELKQTLEKSVSLYPLENGGFLHVSGAKVEFDSSKPAGQRIVKISYKDAQNNYIEIQDNKTYTIATNAFTAKGGDGFDVLKKAYEDGRVTDLGLSDWENLAEHLKSLVNVNPKVEGRIVDVANSQQPEKVDGADFSGTAGQPKVYEGNVTVSISNIASLANAVVKGNLILTGTVPAQFSFNNLQVGGNLDLSQLTGDLFNFDGVDVTGDTIL
ncbi:bifunctional metallophosphatase/5'-nucleotidase [Lysinibacillus sp. FSL W8-0992]|uniref:bifunctional metallophosphatase/5'-nucleotidase n=1 Tax=Lysinibacillus sp. FSL W8-0992 TaxID=2954643 RepID=UPI0030FC7CC3